MRNIAYGIGLVLLCSCSGLIYENGSYSLFADKVVQGEYVSIAESPDRIVLISRTPWNAAELPPLRNCVCTVTDTPRSPAAKEAI